MTRTAITALLLSGTAATAVGCGGSGKPAAAVTQTHTVTVTAAAGSPSAAAGAGAGATIADVVAKVSPAVVNVRIRKYDGDTGEGSGVVIDSRGVVVTNDHVVDGAQTVTVRFTDGRHRTPVKGQVIGASPGHDLAIIRVPLTGLTAVPLGHSGALRLGDTVVAIGFPLDLGGGPTVTQGIVSGLDRTITTDTGTKLRHLLQTDAAINPGNSGGALVDAQGRLIGINAAIAASAQNVGFAIAIDDARPIIERIERPQASGAWLGATFGTIGSASAAVQIGLPSDVRGAVALSVFADGPAARAGLSGGDVVVAADGHTVHSTGDLSKATAGLKVGARVTLDVVDADGPRRVTLTVGKRPATLSKP